MDKKLSIKERWKKAATADNIVDFSVDVFLIVFDVLSSPILIVMRIVRWLLNKFVNKHIKGFIKRIVHWFLDQRKIRLAKGQKAYVELISNHFEPKLLIRSSLRAVIEIKIS